MLFINDGFILSRGKLHTGRTQEKEQIQQEKEAFKYDWSGLEYYPSPLKTVRKRMWERKDLVIRQMESRRDN